MDVGLDHRCVDPHPPSLHHPFGLRDAHDPVMDLPDRCRSQRHAPPAHGLGIGHFAAADAGKIAIHQIGPHLPFQHLVAPVANVFEHQQPQHHFGRGPRPAAAAAVGAPLREGLVHRRHDLRIIEHAIGLSHPDFVQVRDLRGDQPVAKAALSAVRLNHALSSDVSAQRHRNATASG